jgi:hypothetical protein
LLLAPFEYVLPENFETAIRERKGAAHRKKQSGTRPRRASSCAITSKVVWKVKTILA